MDSRTVEFIAHKWRSRLARAKRWLPVVAIGMGATLLAAGTIVVWGGYRIGSAVVAELNGLKSADASRELTQRLDVPTLPEAAASAARTCGQHLASLLSYEPWIRVPLARTFHETKSRCLPGILLPEDKSNEKGRVI